MPGCSMNQIIMKQQTAIAVAQAKQWLEQNARTPWALMKLELMEQNAPEQLQELTESGQLMQAVKTDEKQLTEQYMELMRSGEYNHQSEIGDVMRAQLMEQFPTEPQMSVDELLDRALFRQERLTEEEKNFLRENLPAPLAREVDLLP